MTSINCGATAYLHYLWRRTTALMQIDLVGHRYTQLTPLHALSLALTL